MQAPAAVLYDADCGFCTRAARWLEGRSAGALRAVPIHSAEGDELLAGVAAAERDGSWHLAGADGARLAAGAALAPALRLLPGGRWAVAAALLDALPASWVEAGYRAVARRRALLSRALGAPRCDV